MQPDSSDYKQRLWTDELECDALRHSVQNPAVNLPQAEPISVSSVWQMDSPFDTDAVICGNSDDFFYRRIDHPNARSLANKLARLHGAEKAIVTAQGMSALAAVALSNLQPGATVWIGQELYGETTQLFSKMMAKWHVATQYFDPCEVSQVAKLAAAQGVDLVVIETITNPRLRVPDIRKIAQATHQSGGRLIVDNTFATHLLCRPLDFGADFVVESLGKQVNGHSDGMLGVVCGGDKQRMADIGGVIKSFGLTSSPLDCYLTHRGLMSLAVRLQRTCSNAMALAEMLEQHPSIRGVDYPGLSRNVNHQIAMQQLSGGFGWMLTIHIDADRSGVERLLSELRPDIRFVPSLGDVNTTVSHPRSTSHRDTDADLCARLGIHDGTIRISCGIEPTGYLVETFLAAVEAAKL